MTVSDKDLAKAIGAQIRKVRSKVQMKQREVAATANTTDAYLSSIENGRHLPSLPMLERIAGAMKCSVKSLIPEDL